MAGRGAPYQAMHTLSFAGGPSRSRLRFTLCRLLCLIVTVHETQGRYLIMVNFEAGGRGVEHNAPVNLDGLTCRRPTSLFDAPLPIRSTSGG